MTLETIKTIISALQQYVDSEENKKQEAQANIIVQKCVEAVSELPPLPTLSLNAPVVEITEKGDISVPEIKKIAKLPQLETPKVIEQVEVKETHTLRKTPNLEKINNAIEKVGFEKVVAKVKAEGYTQEEALDICENSISAYGGV